ncbi:MAG: glycosyltransferase family 2 protein [Gemmatales bacterium]
MRQGSRDLLDIDALIHQMNQRYRIEFDRAESLQAELLSYKGSRWWPWFLGVRRLGQWCKAFLPQQRTTAIAKQTASIEPWRTFHPEPSSNLSPAQVSIIIPFRDQVELLERCVLPLHRTVPEVELILVDNGSREHRTKSFMHRCRVNNGATIVQLDEPFNFSKLCNAGAAVAQRDFLLFMNNDVMAAQPCWLESMLECAADPRTGIVGATLLYPDRTLQHAGMAPSGPGDTWIHPYRYEPETHPGKGNELRYIRTVPAVTGACLLIRRTLFEAIDGFDPRYAVTMNDVDLCQRVKAQGYEVIMTPFARLWHFESLSRGYQREAA